MIQQPSTLADLKSYVAAACQLGNPELACSSGNYTLANQQVAQRAYCDRVTELFVRETYGREAISAQQGAKIEQKIQRKAERFANRHKIQRRAESSEKCGFVVIGFLISGLASMLFGKVISALWDWWFKEKATSAATMIARQAAACVGCLDEDGDDE